MGSSVIFTHWHFYSGESGEYKEDRDSWWELGCLNPSNFCWVQWNYSQSKFQTQGKQHLLLARTKKKKKRALLTTELALGLEICCTHLLLPFSFVWRLNKLSPTLNAGLCLLRSKHGWIQGDLLPGRRAGEIKALSLSEISSSSPTSLYHLCFAV